MPGLLDFSAPADTGDDVLDQDNYQKAGGYRVGVGRPDAGVVKAPTPAVTTGTSSDTSVADNTGMGLSVRDSGRMTRPAGALRDSMRVDSIPSIPTAVVRPNTRVSLPTPDSSAPAMPTVAPSTSSPQLDVINRIKNSQQPPAPPQAGAPGSTLGDLMAKRATLSTPTNPNDPKYQMGTGGKVLQTLGNFLRGFGSHGQAEPVYVGKGATNSAYDRAEMLRQAGLQGIDTQIGQQENLNKENRALYESGLKASYDESRAQSQAEIAEARKGTAAAQQTAADARQQLADEKNRDITYDEKTKRFMKDGKTYVPKTIEEGASLEAANNIQGYYSKMWGQERKNQPININTGNKQLSAKDQMRLNAKARELGKNVDDLSDDEINSALYKSPTGPVYTRDKEAFESHWRTQFSNAQKPFDRERSAIVRRGNVPDVTKDKKAWNELDKEDQDQITQSLKELEDRRQQANDDLNETKSNEAEQYGVYGQKGAPKGSPAPAATPSATKTYKHTATNKQTGQKLGSDDGVTWYDTKTGKKYGQ